MKEANSYLTEIGALYGTMLDQVVVEKTTKLKPFERASDKKPGEKKPSKNPFFFKKSGPDMKQVPIEAKINPKFSQAMEKTESKTINNSMSKRFDDLFNNVIQHKLQLEADDIETIEDISAAPEGAGDEGVNDTNGADEDLTVEELLAKACELIQLAQDKMSSGAEEMGESEHGEDGEQMGGENNEQAVGEGQAIWSVDNPVDGSGKILAPTKGTDVEGSAKKLTGTKGTNNQTGDVTKKLAGKGKVGQWSVNNPIDGSGKVIDTSHSTDLAGGAKAYTNNKGQANVVSRLKAGQQIGEL